MLTAQSYLSAGADVASLEQVGFNSQHGIIFTERFEDDCYGLERLPEKSIDFHSLNVTEVDEAIDEFIKSKKIYSLLGGRFGFSEGESCATTCYVSMMAGGFHGLLRADHVFLSRKSVLTPSSLASYAETAKTNELQMFPESKEISKFFTKERVDYLEKISENIERIRKVKIEAELRSRYGNDNQPNM